MDILAGAPAALTIPFIIGTQPVAPDPGSVTYTLRDQTNTPMVGWTDVPYSGTGYEMKVLISSQAHRISGARRFERRTLVVTFKTGGEEMQITRTYRVIPEQLHDTTAADVRAFIGIEEHELPDDDIDLLAALLVVEKELTPAVLNRALVSGTTDELAANTLIKMRAVLDVLPSAKQRMAQSETNGVKQFSRVDLKELDKLKFEAERRYQDAFDELVIVNETNVSIFLVATGADVITGA